MAGSIAAPAAETTRMPATASTQVLTDRFLLAKVAQFQRGLPLFLRELLREFRDHCPDAAAQERGLLWWASVRMGTLSAVQRVGRLWRDPAYTHDARLVMDDLPEALVGWGRLDALQWLHASDFITGPWNPGLLYLSLQRENREIPSWLIQNRPNACQRDLVGAMESAAVLGDLALLREMIAFDPSALAPSVMDLALSKASWSVIQYLHEQCTVGCTTRGLDLAAENGHLDVVRFLHEKRREGCTTEAMDKAASKGHLEIVQFLHEHRSEGCTTDAMDDAAYNGHLEVIQFLHEHRTEGCTVKAMDYAAEQGHLTVVKFLHENRSEGCSDDALLRAADQDHVDVVRFLHEERGLEGDESLLNDAIDRGSMALVQYLHEVMGIDFDDDSLDAAEYTGNAELVDYVRARLTT